MITKLAKRFSCEFSNTYRKKRMVNNKIKTINFMMHIFRYYKNVVRWCKIKKGEIKIVYNVTTVFKLKIIKITVHM